MGTKEEDDFLDQLIEARRRMPEAQKNWDFDEWCREMDSHPAFMKDLAGAEGSETLEAIKALKFDDADSPLDTATQAKADGNRLFKFAKYREAVAAYSEGLAARAPDALLNAQLLANRAAAQARLGNRRSAGTDALKALRFQPDHAKAALRALEAFVALRRPEEARRVIKVFAPPAELTQAQRSELGRLTAEVYRLAKEAQRDQRRAAAKARADRDAKARLLSALRTRRINFSDAQHRVDFAKPEDFDLAQLQVTLPQLGRALSVGLAGEAGSAGSESLVWPVLLCYPEAEETDLVEAWPEDASFADQLQEVLSSPPAWDSARRFRPSSVRLFGKEEERGGALWELPLDAPLATVLASGRLPLPTPLLAFTLLSTESPFTQHFLQNYTVKSL